MALTAQQLITATNAEFTAGDLIAMVDGKHTVLGKNTREGVVLNETGLLLAETLTPKRLRNADPVPETDPPRELGLALADSVTTAEKFGTP